MVCTLSRTQVITITTYVTLPIRTVVTMDTVSRPNAPYRSPIRKMGARYADFSLRASSCRCRRSALTRCVASFSGHWKNPLRRCKTAVDFFRPGLRRQPWPLSNCCDLRLDAGCSWGTTTCRRTSAPCYSAHNPSAVSSPLLWCGHSC